MPVANLMVLSVIPTIGSDAMLLRSLAGEEGRLSGASEGRKGGPKGLRLGPPMQERSIFGGYEIPHQADDINHHRLLARGRHDH